MEQDEEIARDILRTIRQIVRRISIHSKQLQKDVGLSVPQLVCLKAIYELRDADEVTVVQISERVQLSPPTVSRIVERLVAAGLVTRDRSVSDRRKVRLSLTPAALSRVEGLPTALQETFLRKLGELPPAERGRLRDALWQVAQLMSATELDAAPLLAPGDEVPP